MAISIPTNGANLTTYAINSTIKYYVNSRNFTTLDKMFEKYKEDHSDAKIEDYFNSNKNLIYIITDNNYVLIDSSATYDKDKYYYMEDGTAEINCPACSRVAPIGTIKGEDNVEYTCPKCGGKGKVYHTTHGVKVIGITVSVNDNTATGYAIRYRVVPYGSDKSVLVDQKDIYNG